MNSKALLRVFVSFILSFSAVLLASETRVLPSVDRQAALPLWRDVATPFMRRAG